MKRIGVAALAAIGALFAQHTVSAQAPSDSVIVLAPPASSAPAPAAAAPAPDLSAVPDVLLDALQSGNGTYREQYVAQVVMQLRNSGRTKTSLDQQDIEAAQQRLEQQRRRDGLMQILRYDRNFDAQVTPDEIFQAYKEERRGYGDPQAQTDAAVERELSTRVDGLMRRYDKDNNNVIIWSEMTAESAARDGGYGDDRRQGAARLLALDPDHDGKLTVVEVTALAEKAFDTVDSDHDGILSPAERRIVGEWRNSRPRPFQPRPGCAMPAPAPEDKIAFAGIYEGSQFSSVTVAGQNEITSAVTLDLGTEATPAYVVVSSFRPVVWHLAGNLSRLSRLVVMGPKDRNSNAVMAGVAGIGADKISFVPNEGCLPTNGMFARAAAGAPSPSAAITAALTQLLGRAPSAVASINKAKAVHLAGGNVVLDDPAAGAPAAAPAGYDPKIWANLALLNKGAGIDQLDKAKVVSNNRAEDYLVPPSWAGLAKLVAEGRLQPVADGAAIRVLTSPDGSTTTVRGGANMVISDPRVAVTEITGLTYKVVKEIPAFPAGLTGSYNVKFIIGRGVKMPPSFPGASCITFEDPLEAKNAALPQPYGCR